MVAVVVIGGVGCRNSGMLRGRLLAVLDDAAAAFVADMANLAALNLGLVLGLLNVGAGAGAAAAAAVGAATSSSVGNSSAITLAMVMR